jgi:large subunit ribosomal protein L18
MSKKIDYKRKRNGKTDYKKRLKLLISKKPRLVIRKTLTQIIAQIVDYGETGDKVIVSVKSSELKKLGLKLNTSNVPSAYLTGLLIGKRAKEKKIKEVVLDLGLNTPTKGSKIFSALKGVVDSGLKIPHSEDMFSDEEAINGIKINNFLKESKNKIQFSKYKKDKIDPAKNFEAVKSKIMK